MKLPNTTRWLLLSAVLAILGAPLALLFFFALPFGLATAVGLFLYGSIALWMGLKGIESRD